MSDKTVKELAQMVQKPVEKLLEQLADAGLPQRTAESLVTDSEQERLVAFLKRSHGQQPTDTRITLTRKTTSTAKVASTSGKTKSINVEVRKRHTFVKPDAASIAAEARAKADAEAQARADMISRQKAEAEAREKARQATEAREQAVREAAAAPKAQPTAASKKDAPAKKRIVKEESPAEKQAREAEIARLKAAEETARRVAAEAAQQRTLEQMRQMATKYATGEAVVERKIDESTPLARGLVGRAYEESFDKENREIKRGVATTPNARAGKGARGGRNRQEEQRIRPANKGFKTSQGNQHGFEKPVEKQVYDVQIGETIVVADLAQKMAVKAREVIRMLMKMGEMVRETEEIDQATAALVVEELGHNPILVSDTAVEDNLMERPVVTVVTKKLVHQWSPSWVTLTMVRPRCLTTFAVPKWPQAKPVALPSILVRTTLKPSAVSLPFWIHRVTPHLRQCAPVVPKRLTLWSLWSLRTMASCHKPPKPLIMPVQPVRQSLSH